MEASPQIPWPQRFNLVLHGMMLIVEQEDHLEILIPEIKGHEYRFGRQPHDGDVDGNNIPIPSLGYDKLTSLGRGATYQLEGVQQKDPLRLRELISPLDHVIFKSSMVEVDFKSNLIYCRLIVPRPQLIRGYRAIEVVTSTLDQDCVLGDSAGDRKLNRDLLLASPKVLHNAICLSYFVPVGSKILFGDLSVNLDGNPPHASGDTICVYAEEPIISDVVDHGQELERAERHVTVNDLFVENRAIGKFKPTAVCRVPGYEDRFSYPEKQLAMGHHHLRSLPSLSTPHGNPGQGGCTGFFVSYVD